MAPPRDAWTEGLVGSTLAGRYRLEGMLGAGGMGAVFAGIHLGVGRRVAVKVLSPHVGRDRVATERFRQEAQLAASVARRGVVDVFDYDVDPTAGPFLVMEYLYGESLAERIGRLGVLAPAEAVRIVSSLLATLSVIHAQGVLHRDLKPANVFLAVTPEGDEEVKILDFGLARVAEALSAGPLTAPGLALGTPSYMAPEQLLGEPLDARVDIYGVGGVLFSALTSRPPRLVGPDVGHIEDPPPIASLRPDLPASLAAVVDRALARSRTSRFASPAAMLEALGASGVITQRSSGEPTVPTPIVVPHAPTEAVLGSPRGSDETAVARRPRRSVPSSPPAVTGETPLGERRTTEEDPEPAGAGVGSGADGPSRERSSRSTPAVPSGAAPSAASSVAPAARRSSLALGIGVGIVIGIGLGVGVLVFVSLHLSDAPEPVAAAPPVVDAAPALLATSPDSAREEPAEAVHGRLRAALVLRASDPAAARRELEALVERAARAGAVPNGPVATYAAQALLAIGELEEKSIDGVLPGTGSADTLREHAASVGHFEAADRALARVRQFDGDDLWQCASLRRADIADRLARATESLPDPPPGDNGGAAIATLRASATRYREQAAGHLVVARDASASGACAVEARTRAEGLP